MEKTKKQWEDLANAVVLSAIDDYIEFEVFSDEKFAGTHGYRMFKDAERFLFGKRIKLFTELDVNKLIEGRKKNGKKADHKRTSASYKRKGE